MRRKVLIDDVLVIEKSDSIWWMNIILSYNSMLLLNHNFSGEVSCKVGSSMDILFWHGCWAAIQPLTVAYPELYVCAGRDYISVAEAGIHTSSGWVWNEASIFAVLLSLLLCGKSCVTASNSCPLILLLKTVLGGVLILKKVS